MKKIYYVQMNAVGFATVAVLAKDKKDALKVADKNRHVVTCHCDGFESSEVLDDYVWAEEATLMDLTEDDPAIEV